MIVNDPSRTLAYIERLEQEHEKYLGTLKSILADAEYGAARDDLFKQIADKIKFVLTY
jgi:hypothetical protein